MIFMVYYSRLPLGRHPPDHEKMSWKWECLGSGTDYNKAETSLHNPPKQLVIMHVVVIIYFGINIVLLLHDSP